MENIREYKLKENIKVKLYSDLKMYRKIFYLLLNCRIRESERELNEGTYIDFEDVVKKLNKKYGGIHE